MVTGIPGTVDTITMLIDSLKKEDAAETSKKMSSLLIQYILAQMSGNKEQAQEIINQISDLCDKYGSDLQNADALKAKLEAIQNDPNAQTSSELQDLQNLAAMLEQAARSGNTSILQH